MGNSYQQLAQVHLERGEQAAAGPHLERAVAYYDTILQRPDTPYKWESQFNRAYALQSMGDVASEERAERAYQALVEEADESYVRRSLLQLSELSFKRGDYGLSDSLANQVLVLFPEAEGLDNAHMRRALALQSLERYEDSTNESYRLQRIHLTMPAHGLSGSPASRAGAVRQGTRRAGRGRESRGHQADPEFFIPDGSSPFWTGQLARSRFTAS